ncbi:hypothetical protein L6452_27257 [Arctium lappa]|uniref:Uncharacterized protein n=1 Tax=Arctium lappa TaxID=4217 RepID=A0ACB8ZXF1_ARCLA|nr:hypothetical protein L6452_27257 [Arctium lappa]
MFSSQNLSNNRRIGWISTLRKKIVGYDSRWWAKERKKETGVLGDGGRKELDRDPHETQIHDLHDPHETQIHDLHDPHETHIHDLHDPH